MRLKRSEPISNFHEVWQTNGFHQGQDASLLLETSPVKLVPTYTWVEWGNGGELSFPWIKLAAHTPEIKPQKSTDCLLTKMCAKMVPLYTSVERKNGDKLSYPMIKLVTLLLGIRSQNYKVWYENICRHHQTVPLCHWFTYCFTCFILLSIPSKYHLILFANTQNHLILCKRECVKNEDNVYSDSLDLII